MTNTQHIWTRENIEVYLTDGLSSDERAKIEQHVADCHSCAAALEEAITTDQSVKELFAGAQPKPGLEDRIIRSLRYSPPPKTVIHPMFRRVALGIAAVALMGVLGFVVQSNILSSNAPTMAGLRNAEDEITMGTADKGNVFERRSPDVDGEGRGNFGPAALPPAPQSPSQMADRRADNMLANLDKPIGTHSAGGSVVHSRTKVETYGGEDDHFERQRDGTKFHDEVSKLKDMNKNGAWNFAQKGKEVEELKDANEKLSKDAEGKQQFRSEAPANRAQNPNFFKPGEIGRKNDPAKTEPPPTPAEKKPAQDPKGGQPQQPQEPQVQRKIIRHGDMEFEVEGFDSAFVQISKIVAEEGGFISSTNSEKLPNGKVRGTVIVRVPPDRLDVLVLKLRALGELKSQRISAQDVTKHYTDLESELRAGRAMEERLLSIIKSGKGEIKDLLEAEKQLGVYREKIEKLEGEIRYYNNLISLSTLNITLAEKDIKTPTSATETERVDVGLETDEVEKAYQDALKAIAEKKGRVTRSELKKYDAGQLFAEIVCEVPPGEAATMLVDRLRQLGRVAKLEMNRSQTTAGGIGRPNVHVDRKDTIFNITLYNLANIQARETVHMNLACASVEGVYKAMLDRIEKAGGRVISSNLYTQKADQTTAQIQFEIKAAEAEKVQADIRVLGEVMHLQVTENADTQNVTKAKRGFVVNLQALASVPSRESIAVTLAARSVTDAYRSLTERLQKMEGRVINSNLDERDRHNVTGYLDVEIRRADMDDFEKAMKEFGDLTARHATRAGEGQNVVNSKIRYTLTMINIERVPARETSVVAIEVSDVEKVFGELQVIAAGANGRVVDSNLLHKRSGEKIGRLVIDVPLAKSMEILGKIKDLGTIRVFESSKNPQVPEGNLAKARIEVTVGSHEQIVPQDEGIGATIRSGLATSFKGLMFSLNLIVIGLCFIVPWALILWGGYRIVKRSKKPATPAA
jgi:hypothetical protein